ncbi:MAG: hypothetical protein K6A33_01830, partial [Clostridiales bacterium]|nr:hypothetical protein [Clostridiales bacterium]
RAHGILYLHRPVTFIFRKKENDHGTENRRPDPGTAQKSGPDAGGDHIIESLLACVTRTDALDQALAMNPRYAAWLAEEKKA